MSHKCKVHVQGFANLHALEERGRYNFEVNEIVAQLSLECDVVSRVTINGKILNSNILSVSCSNTNKVSIKGKIISTTVCRIVSKELLLQDSVSTITSQCETGWNDNFICEIGSTWEIKITTTRCYSVINCFFQCICIIMCNFYCGVSSESNSSVEIILSIKSN